MSERELRYRLFDLAWQCVEARDRYGVRSIEYKRVAAERDSIRRQLRKCAN
jgi:hypothetical protein